MGLLALIMCLLCLIHVSMPYLLELRLAEGETCSARFFCWHAEQGILFYDLGPLPNFCEKIGSKIKKEKKKEDPERGLVRIIKKKANDFCYESIKE